MKIEMKDVFESLTIVLIIVLTMFGIWGWSSWKKWRRAKDGIQK